MSELSHGRRRSRRVVFVGATLGVGALLGAAGLAGVEAAGSSSSGSTATAAANPATTTPDVAITSSSYDAAAIYAKDSPGVVDITVTESASPQSGNGLSPFVPGGSQQAQAEGTGFVYDRQGDIVTASHVVSGATKISVRFKDGTIAKATLVGSDASSDLAVIKVNAPSSLLHPLALADSDKVQVGDDVVAIGSPFGLEGTITSGIVSALHRDIKAPNNFTITDTIQTDAAINHGNSGGVLLDTSGDVIGVTAQIDSESGGNDGVGFAIPSNTVRSIVSQLMGGGSVQRAYLGVHIQTIPSDVASQLNLAAGVEITSVVGNSPAGKAGLKGATGSQDVNGDSYATGGDVITAVNGKPVSSADTLQTEIAGKKPGATVNLTVVHGGSTKTVTVKLGSRPS